MFCEKLTIIAKKIKLIEKIKTNQHYLQKYVACDIVQLYIKGGNYETRYQIFHKK